MMRKRSYVPYFDFLKGIAILLVIAIHTYDISGAKEGIAGDINLLLRQIIQCAVPIFVAVSGYFVVKSRGPYISYLKQRVLKIYVPALVWSLPYLIEAFGKGYRLLPILGIYFICGFSIYYFIALIMQFYVISPVLCKYFSNRGGGIFIMRNDCHSGIRRILQHICQRHGDPAGSICRSLSGLDGLFRGRDMAWQYGETRL